MEAQLLGDCMRLIFVEGLTANHVSKYNQKVDELLKNQPEYAEVILDLSNIRNIDSVGVTFVISLYKRFESIGINFSVSGASDDIMNLFKLMKLDQFFDMRK